MPPTVQTIAERDNRQLRAGEKRSELVCRVKYCNTLPDIPFDPKFITYPFLNTRFIQYSQTSLERNYKYDVLTEHDLGVTIDLIDRDVYTVDHNAQLDPADEKLLEEDVLTPQDSKRSRHHARSVSWLRRTEYISTEQTRFQPQTMDKVEAKVGYSIKKSLKDEAIILDRETQIKAIEKTFEDSKIPIEKHYSKPNVTPVEILPIYPDFKLWKYPCAQVIFDSDPAPADRSLPAQMEEMSQAMIRGVMDESGEQFVAYFLPTEDTLQKRRRDFTNEVLYEDEEDYEYKMTREYNWNVKSKSSKGYEENYFLVLRNDGIYYNELETRVRLSKRRQKLGQMPNNTRLVVRHRPLNAQEFRMQRYRERMLEVPGEEDEEEEEEEEDTNADQKTGERTENDDSDGRENEEGSRNEEDKEDRDDDDDDNEKRNDAEDKDGSEEENDETQDREDEDKDAEQNEVNSREHSDSEGGHSGSGREDDDDDEEKPASRSSRSRSRSRSRSQSRSRSSSAASHKSSGSAASGSESGSASARSSGSASGSGSDSESAEK